MIQELSGNQIKKAEKKRILVDSKSYMTFLKIIERYVQYLHILEIKSEH
jgi:hypothetical protein